MTRVYFGNKIVFSFLVILVLPCMTNMIYFMFISTFCLLGDDTGGENFIDFARLRPSHTAGIPGEQLKLYAKFSVCNAKENAMFNVVSKCTYGCTIDEEKKKLKLEDLVKTWKAFRNTENHAISGRYSDPKNHPCQIGQIELNLLVRQFVVILHHQDMCWTTFYVSSNLFVFDDVNDHKSNDNVWFVS